MTIKYVSGTILLIFLFVSPSFGGWLDSVVEKSAKRVAEKTINRAANDSSDAAYSKAKEGLSKDDAVSKDPAQSKGSSDKEQSAASRSDSSGAPAGEAGDSEQDAVAAGEVYSNRFDFIAGDNVLFFEDFSDTDPGDYPRRWTPGEGKSGPVEVVEFLGKHWLKSLAEGQKGNMRHATTFMRVDLKKELPDKFTVEFDIPSSARIAICFPGKYWATGSDSVSIAPESVEMYWGHAKNDSVKRSNNPLRHVSIAVSGTNVKVYFDGERVLLAPDGVRVRAKSIRTIGFYFPESSKPLQDRMFTNFRLAEGGKDYAKELVNGRIVTHGITFDSGSDVLKPESGPTLWKIHKLLQDNADLKFEIQGHTDDTGSTSVNQPLSEKRAAAVKKWLVAQGIDDTRLETRGFGDTKPLGPNDTPEGRANNRRVEFVKQ